MAPDRALHTSADEATYALVGYTLFYGLLVAIAVMVAGLVDSALQDKPLTTAVLPLDRVFPSISQGHPSAILDLGILCLFATPLVGVIVALAEFLRVGDRPFAGITSAVGVLLCVGFVVALY